jgi:hypothetical protein
VVLHGNKQTLPLARWIFALKKAADCVNLYNKVDARAVAFSAKKPPVEAVFGIVVLLSH